MNPDSFFREALESHDFRSSDILFVRLPMFLIISFMSDNANLLDVMRGDKAGRFVHHILDESAARD